MPLVTDLKILEEHGIYVSYLGKVIKGSVFNVVADNLGVNSVAGFLENFTGSHICRFCLAERSQFQVGEVRLGTVPLRTIQEHNLHVQLALNKSTNSSSSKNSTHCFGFKKQCVFTEKLKYFPVSTGYPPDAVHNLLEGIVPVELALCLDTLIKHKYFSLEELNHFICKFPYKWSNKANCPQGILLTFASL